MHVKTVKKYDYAVFIGRFAPVHGYVSDNPDTINGHVKVMMEALEQADKLIVVVGSNNAAPNTRNPFTAEQRIEMIRCATGWNPRIILTSVGDYPYDDNKWISAVQGAVDKIFAKDGVFNPKVALAGMYKDETSYYLNSFPQWASAIAITPGTYDGEIISATGIRNAIFNGELNYVNYLSPDLKTMISIYQDTNIPLWDRLKSDWDYEQKYESQWGKGPHVTVDSLVIQAGHILLIQRGREYGRGLWALPGGFLNRREKIVNGALRELREETKLKVPEKVLRGCIEDVKVFDDPYRSNRSRLITHVVKIVLNNVGGLPDVMGADDAEKAKWVPISSVKTLQMFEDHGAIIADMLGLE